MEGMKEIFRLHGASPMASTAVGIAPTDFPSDAVTLLAPDGSPWGLRYDLRYPFAAWLARQATLLGTSAPLYLCATIHFACRCSFGVNDFQL